MSPCSSSVGSSRQHFRVGAWIFLRTPGDVSSPVCLWQQVFLRNSWDIWSPFTGNQNRLFLSGSQTRYFNPHQVFSNLTKWFLSLNLSRVWSQRCDERETHNSTSKNIKQKHPVSTYLCLFFRNLLTKHLLWRCWSSWWNGSIRLVWSSSTEAWRSQTDVRRCYFVILWSRQASCMETCDVLSPASVVQQNVKLQKSFVDYKTSPR